MVYRGYHRIRDSFYFILRLTQVIKSWLVIAMILYNFRSDSVRPGLGLDEFTCDTFDVASPVGKISYTKRTWRFATTQYLKF